uniref:Pumilio RNA-binding family member 3 n=1 Tax=Myripristis murdjan TaxID=586833 RepID=A0A667Z4M7_9TELE
MEAKPRKKFSPKAGKKLSHKGKDSIGTKLGGKPGGKPGGKKPFKPYNTAEKRSKWGKSGDGAKKDQKFPFSKAGKGPRKRKLEREIKKEEEGGEEEEVDEEEAEGSEPKKMKWGDFKQKKKELKKTRQQAEKKDMFDIINQSKHIWGNLRRYTHTHTHTHTHTLNPSPWQFYIKQEVFDELKDDMVGLCKSQYGRHIVKKLLMYSNKELLAAVMQMFRGQVRQMLRHAAASFLIEYAYNDKAVLAQRLMLTEELYGNTFIVCKSTVCPTLEKVLEANPDKLNNILDEMKQILTPMAQKEQVIRHSLVHKVFLDFFLFAPDKMRMEMIESIRESVVYMAHTHDGARVAMHCLWHGTPKDRKVIIKTMKTYMVKFATGEFGHLVLLAIFDCVDDTKLVKQAVLSEILSSLDEVISNKYGKKVLLYLLSPRDPAHLLPEIIKVLEQGDGNAHSKKDAAIRRKELLEAVSPPLLGYLHDNAAAMVMDKATSVTVSDILASACGDLQPAMTAVAQLANQELVPGGTDGQLHMAEHPAGHLVLKWLIEQDYMLAEAGKQGTHTHTHTHTWLPLYLYTSELLLLFRAKQQ